MPQIGLKARVARLVQRLSGSFSRWSHDHHNDLLLRQIEETQVATPTFSLIQFLAVVAVAKITSNSLPNWIWWSWTTAGLVITAIILAAFHFLSDAADNQKRSALTLKAAPLFALAFGSLWAAAPLVSAVYCDFQITGMVFAVVIMIMLVGHLCMVRLPVSAIIATVPVVSALTYAATNRVPGLLGLGATVGAVALVALFSMTILMHMSFVKLGEKSHERRRNGEVIKLLLNDFETEASDWLWETDTCGKLKFSSGGLAQALKSKSESLNGHFLGEVLGLHDPTVLNEKLQRGETFMALPVQSVKGEAVRHLELTAKPQLDAFKRFVGHYGVGRDVTLRSQQTTELEAAHQEAEKANAAKSQFLAVMSHELRTPINAIVGFSEVLRAGQGENLPVESRKEYLGTIVESAKHLQNLINDVLDATRIERGTLHLDEQLNDAAELIEVAVKILRDQAEQAKISLVVHVIEDVQVMSDLTRLKQVILNLVSNAIKFSPEGSVVNIDMSRTATGNLVISVRDAGIGISKEDAERVFEPFVQVENGHARRFGGMGLGLAIARRIARLHGGDLTLDGAVGVGTDARLTFPAARLRWPKPRKPSEVVAA